MFTVKFYVPIESGEGYFSHSGFEGILVEMFGGFTRYPGAYKGAWVADSKCHRDENYVYEVNLGSIVNAEKISTVVTYAKSRYEQKAIYVKYMGISEIL